MSFTTCNYCHKGFSKRLKSCPHCKNKNELYWHYKKNDILGTLAFLGMMCILLSYFMSCSEKSRAKEQTIENCISRGIVYFKEIGAYPTLTTTGENAEEVAKVRCNRTITAF